MGGKRVRGSFVFFLVAVVITLIAFAGLVFHSLQAVDPIDVPEDARLGKLVWQEKACVECHAVLGHGGYFGPDLTTAWAKHGADGLKHFFMDPPVLPTATKKRHLGLSEEEAELVIHFLKFVEGIKRTGNWPPKPPFSSPEGR